MTWTSLLRKYKHKIRNKHNIYKYSEQNNKKNRNDEPNYRSDEPNYRSDESNYRSDEPNLCYLLIWQ